MDYGWNDFRLLKEKERRGLRRDANFVGIGMLVLTAAMQLVYPLVLLVLVLLRIVSPQDMAKGDLGLGNTAYLLTYMLVYIIAMGFPMVLASLIAKRRINPFSPAKPVQGFTFLLALLGGLAMCVVANFVASLTVSFFSQFGINPPDMPSFLVDTPVSLALNILIVAVLPAFLEEMVFRGYVLQTLRPYGGTTAIVFSALLFSLMHGNILQIPFAFLVGLVLGYIVVQTENIWAAVTLHFLNNFMAVLLEYATLHAADEQAANRMVLLVYLIVALIGLAAVIALSYRRSALSSRVEPPRSALTAGERAGTILTAPALLISVVLFVVLTLLTTQIGSIT